MPEFVKFHPDTHPYQLTNEDICVRTTNPMRKRVIKNSDQTEQDRLQTLAKNIQDKEAKMDADYRQIGHYLAEDQTELAKLQSAHDYFLAQLQIKYRLAAPTSRTHALLAPKDGLGLVPFGFANMNRVMGKRMGEADARRGSWGAWPQGKSDRLTVDYLDYVQSRHTRFLTPVQGLPTMSVRDALFFLQKRPLGHVVMTDERAQILRILPESLLKRYGQIDEEMDIGSIPMSEEEQRVVVGFDDMSAQEGLSLMRTERIHFLPISNRVRKSRRKLLWALTRKEAEIQEEFPAFLDAQGRLATVIAVSMFREGWEKKIEMLIAKDVTAIVLDSPHAYQGLDGGISIEGTDEVTKEEFRPRVKRAAETVAQSAKPIHLIIGNVDDPEAVRSMIAAAIEAGMKPTMITVKVGIGPGHACVTREEAGIGMPQWSTVYECAQAARKMGANVQADGGVALPADIEKYIAAGASHVMIGSKGVPLVESSAVLKTDEHGVYGVNYGMGSDIAYSLREDVPQGPGTAKFNEGLRYQRVYQTAGIVDVTDFVARYGRGMMSFLLFNGSKTLEEAYDVCRISLQHSAGFREGLGKKIVV